VPGSASDSNQSPKNTSVFSATFASLLIIVIVIAVIITVYLLLRFKRKSANKAYMDNVQNIGLNQEMVLSD
jgi:flagellar biogenesis protein FliO